MKKLVAAAVATTAMLVPSAASASTLVSVGDVSTDTGDVASDNCTNININTGIEKDKTQKC